MRKTVLKNLAIFTKSVFRHSLVHVIGSAGEPLLENISFILFLQKIKVTAVMAVICISNLI